MGFKLETHMHTSESSLCGRVSAADQVKQYIEYGYDGIIVTDHFVNGNSAVNRSDTWQKQMKKQFLGYYNALKAAAGTDLKVFLGTEYAYHGTEFIIVGLSDTWFLENQSIIFTKPEEFLKIFDEKKAGIIQCHPFREAAYIKEFRLYPELVHAVEVFNLANEDSWNDKALQYAKEYNKPMTAGSDCHHIGRLGAGIELDVAPRDERELADIIRSGKGWKHFGESINNKA